MASAFSSAMMDVYQSGMWHPERSGGGNAQQQDTHKQSLFTKALCFICLIICYGAPSKIPRSFEIQKVKLVACPGAIHKHVGCCPVRTRVSLGKCKHAKIKQKVFMSMHKQAFYLMEMMLVSKKLHFKNTGTFLNGPPAACT